MDKATLDAYLFFAGNCHEAKIVHANKKEFWGDTLEHVKRQVWY